MMKKRALNLIIGFSAVIGALSLGLTSVFAATGSISASDNPCILAQGENTCSVSISWNSSNSDAELWVVNRSTGNEAKVSGSSSGSATISWIVKEPGHRFEIRLGTQVLDSVVAYGIAPSGSISVSPNPCEIPYGNSTCSSLVSWSASVGEAELWVVNRSTGNQAKVSGSSSGSVSISWIVESPGHRFEVRFGDEVLAGAVVYGIKQEPPSVAVYRGGSNYVWHGIGTSTDPVCGRSGHGVIKYFDENLSSSQLASMFASGQRSLRIGIYYDSSTKSYGNVLPLKQDGDGSYFIENAYIEAIDSLLSIAVSIGFESFQFAFMPQGKSSAGNTQESLDKLVDQSIAVYRQIIPIAESHSINVLYDLRAEGIPHSGSTRKLNFARKLWSRFNNDSVLSAFSGRAFISQILSSTWSARNRTVSMGYVYGNNFPQYYQFSVYDSTDSPLEIFSTFIDEINDQGYPDRTWIVGESYLNDAHSASGIADALIALNREVLMLYQWPVERNGECDHNSVEFPGAYYNYSSKGF